MLQKLIYINRRINFKVTLLVIISIYYVYLNNSVKTIVKYRRDDNEIYTVTCYCT